MKVIVIVNYVESLLKELVYVYESQESMNDSLERIDDDPRAELSSIKFNNMFKEQGKLMADTLWQIWVVISRFHTQPI